MTIKKKQIEPDIVCWNSQAEKIFGTLTQPFEKRW